jgi:hypothetical protein
VLLYKKLILTLRKENNTFIDDIATIEDAKKFLNENLIFCSIDEETIFYLEHLRHLFLKYVKQAERLEKIEYLALNKFVEKMKSSELLHINDFTIDFVKKDYHFLEPYQSFLQSFKNDFIKRQI